LNLSNNRICEVPKAIARLERLQSINLSFNNISILPKAIEEIEGLRFIYLEGNPELTNTGKK